MGDESDTGGRRERRSKKTGCSMVSNGATIYALKVRKKLSLLGCKISISTLPCVHESMLVMKKRAVRQEKCRGVMKYE